MGLMPAKRLLYTNKLSICLSFLKIIKFANKK